MKGKMRKRVALPLILAVIIALLVQASPVAVQAADTTIDSSATVLPTTSGTYTLGGNCTLTATAYPANYANIILDLNGYTITGPTGRIYDFTNTTGATLTIKDSSSGATGAMVAPSGSTTTGGIVYLAAGNTFVLEGGTLNGAAISVSATTSDTTNPYGAAINAKGTVRIEGGTIIGGQVGGGKVNHGGGAISVYGQGGTVTMTGGTITGGTGTCGGAVSLLAGATFTMAGGTISGGTANYDGGNIFAWNSTFNISGGTVTGGTAPRNGRNLCLHQTGKLNATGGTISDGSATAGNGSVYMHNQSTVTLTGSPVLSNVYLNDTLMTIGASGLQSGASIHFTLPAGVGLITNGTATADHAAYFHSTDGKTVGYVSGALYVGEYYTTGLRVGYAERNYGPLCLQYQMGLAGYDNDASRITQSVDAAGLDIEVLAAKDEDGNVALICSVEAITIAPAFHTTLRNAAASQCGIPSSNIIITANHQHSTPTIGANQFSQSAQFNEAFKTLFLEAAAAAVADLNTATANTVVRTATVDTDGMSYVRNTKVYGKADNVYRGMVSTNSHIDPGVTRDWEYYFVAEEGSGDETLQLVWFDRADMKDIVLANFSTHPHSFTGGSTGTVASAGFTGAFRDLVSAANGDCYTMYISGASGDTGMTTTSTVIQTRKAVGSAEQVTAPQTTLSGYAAKMAGYVPALNAEGAAWTARAASDVEATVGTVTLSRNDEKKELLSIAQQIVAGGEATRTSLMSQYTSYTQRGSYIYSVGHAQQIVARAANPITETMDVYAISIGDVSFAGVPYEMFASDGVYVKDNNNHSMTIVASLANGHNGYVPSLSHWFNGGYSCDISKYAAGSSVTLNAKLVEILNQIAGNP